MQTTYDAVIVGAGAAGLLCAIWLAQHGVKVGIFEKQSERPVRGRADGLEPRTLEILNSFGLLDTWWRDANQTVELSVWVSRCDQQLERVLRRTNSAKGTSEFSNHTMDQSVVERAMEEYLLARHRVPVRYGVETLSLVICETAADPARPVNLAVRQVGRIYQISSKYAVGADGAHSWMREQAGVKLEVTPTSQCWGVVDIHPLTNFPDIRHRCIIHSQQVGTLMVIPREAGMVRLYVQLNDPKTEVSSETDASDIVAAAQKIVAPYKLSFRHCYRASRYTVKQGLATRFSAHQDRIFLVGDAVHTHSPKAGMGLNTSLQDAYNLAWKLAAVIRGKASPRLLETYEEERRPVADFLIRFDREFLQIFQSPLDGMSIEQYRETVISATTKEHVELSGISVCYAGRSMFDDTRMNHQSLAAGIVYGSRLPPSKAVNHSDGRSRTIHDLLPSNGQWRLLVFPGDLRDPQVMQRYVALSHDLESCMPSLTLPGKMFNESLEIISIHRSPRHEIELLDLPALYHPWDEEFGWNYDRIFTDEETPIDPTNTGDLYSRYGIGNKGCVILLRPDQHVIMIAGLNQAANLCEEFLARYAFEAKSSIPH